MSNHGSPIKPNAVTEPSAAGALAGGFGALRPGGADVGVSRERLRRRRVAVLGLVVGLPALAWLVARDLGHDVIPSMPHLDPLLVTPIAFFLLLGVVLVASMVGPGRSPHLTYRPEQLDVKLDDVRGIEPVKEDVVRSLNLFLAHKTFAAEMGGTPRRGLLFEGAPGTGKTYLAKAMAAEAGGAVPVCVRDLVPVDVLRRDGPQDPQLLQGAAQDRPPRGRRDRVHRRDRRDRHAPRRDRRHAVPTVCTPACPGKAQCTRKACGTAGD